MTIVNYFGRLRVCVFQSSQICVDDLKEGMLCELLGVLFITSMYLIAST